jgi:biopolymer transport protein ExbD
MTPYRIKRHRLRRHGANHFALIPFIDMMTILVVFLLAHTAEVDILPNTKNISIPQSLSDRKPSAAVVVNQLPVAPFSKAELFPDISIGDAPT